MIELGAQNLYGDFDCSLCDELFDEFGPGDRTTVEQAYRAIQSHDRSGFLLRAAGFHYTSLDMFSDSTTMRFDLNTGRLPWRMRGVFDLVTNLGTAEHVINQYNVFRTMHDALKVGGVALCNVPFYGQANHGFFKYEPKFFTSLAVQNNYQIIDWIMGYLGTSTYWDSYHGMTRALHGTEWEGRHLGSSDMTIIWQKTQRGRFQVPLDTHKVTGEARERVYSVDELLPADPLIARDCTQQP
jgi:hypothetical protein